MTPRLPVLFISHGGGPWPYIDAMRPQYVHTERELRRLPARLPARPKAVLVISGHWEAAQFSVASSARPGMEYDYSGFPPHTYEIRYAAPGDPVLAARARALIAGAGLEVALDPRRGFDHGVFVPLGLMYPQADMPIVMVSIKSTYDPREHLALGRALEPLRDEEVLIIGSGLNYHNMQGFGRNSATADAEVFNRYLREAIEGDARQREERLSRWESAPRARLAHPREDHLMPLLVAEGASGGDPGRMLFSENVMAVPMESYGFGDFKASLRADPALSPSPARG
jgi:aromatic ring-opening dioxygenase catalytic subunit (LigB family)